MTTKRKRELVAAAGAILLLATLFSVQSCSSGNGEPRASGSAVKNNSTETISLKVMERVSTGSMDENGVLVELRPVDFKDGRLSVKLRANTHIGNLADYDLNDLTTLFFDGRAVKPSSAGKLSGHHSSALVEFETGSLPEAFSVTIAGIRNVEERIFNWMPEAGGGGEEE